MTARFGWCIDNRHEQCRAITSPPDGELVCDCSCHTGADEVRGDHDAEREADLNDYAREDRT